MIKAYIFDVDGTVYNYDRAHAAAFAKTAQFVHEELGLSEDEFTSLTRSQLHAIAGEMGACAAIHNRTIRFQRVLEQKKLPLRYASILNDYYWHALIAASEPEPGIADALRALKEQGYTLGIGTNMTSDWQFAKLSGLGLLDYFDFLVSSEEACAEKPDSRLFALCAKKAGCQPSECVFVGDNLKADYQGALNAGMHGVLYAPEGGIPEGIRGISSFHQLKTLNFMV